MARIDKSKMACNKPKAQRSGDKSHVVKACSGGKEKVIRFGQAGVKGSPKGSARNKAFRARHAKNIATKSKMDCVLTPVCRYPGLLRAGIIRLLLTVLTMMRVT